MSASEFATVAQVHMAIALAADINTDSCRTDVFPPVEMTPVNELFENFVQNVSIFSDERNPLQRGYMRKILYLDCFSGASGDMTVGALLDLDVSHDDFKNELNKLGLDGYAVAVEKKRVGGIMGTDFKVTCEESSEHRGLREIEAIIEQSSLRREVKELSMKIFRVLAVAEAKVHGKSVDEIHFHEVGAVDSIVDIVGAAICFSLLKADKICASPLNVGGGLVKCAHGVLPVPAPAVAEILKGVPVCGGNVDKELVTPTGAAIVKVMADNYGPFPSMILEKTGYGCGKRRYEIPNLLRACLGREASIDGGLSEKLTILETNLDDMNPEIYSWLVPLLFRQGALDAFLTNIIMKKGRPGTMLSVLCRPQDSAELEKTIFAETTTLGIRRSSTDRIALERKIIEVATEFGTVKAKAALENGRIVKIAPEYEDCRAVAMKTGLPLKKVYERILASGSKAFQSE